MNQPSTFARRAIRTTGVGATLLLTSLGLAVAPAGAVTNAVTTTSSTDWVTVDQDYTDNTCGTLATENAPSLTSALTAGPGTPPSGTGSLKLTTADDSIQQLLRSKSFAGTELADLESIQYSTYIETAGKQPPYLRLHIDNTDDGAADEILMFIPANNVDTEGRGVTEGVWQTWDVLKATSVLNVNQDLDPTDQTTFEAYKTANPSATIVDSFVPSDGEDPNRGGGVSFIIGCSGANQAGMDAFLDEIVVDVAGAEVEKYDFEATAPARTLTVNPTSADKGSTVTISGTDCFEPTATAGMGQSFGESGDDLGSTTVNTAANGTWSATFTIPANADAGAKQSVYAYCGPDAMRAFSYANQAFDVTGQANPNGANGYRMVAADGGIFTFGARNFHGSTGNLVLNKPIVGGATDISDYEGYWIVASDGGVFNFSAPFFGSLGDQTLTSPAVEIEPTPSGKGYFIVLANGKVHTFGDAEFSGDMIGKSLNKPIIGMSVTPTGKGYWLVAEDGGIFNFGDAKFFGSMGDKVLNAPVIDLAPAVDNNGYYLLGRDGGVFTFGSADFKGSTGAMTLNAPVVAMLVNPAGSGYWLAASDGGIFTFGAGADFLGSMGGTKLNSPVLDLIN